MYYCLASFPSIPSHETTRKRSDGLGPGRFGGISSFFRAHGKEGLRPVSDDDGWCIKIRDTHVQSAISLVIPEIPDEKISSFFCRFRDSFSLFNICASTWVDLCGKVLQLKLDSVMTLDD